jgi:hypothetical protein
MTAYVRNPSDPDNVIDVIKLQDQDPLKVLEPCLIYDRMNWDTWTRREALMLLAGYYPATTIWTETNDGFGDNPAGNCVGYLDKLTEKTIRHAEVSWRHPRYEEASEQFHTLCNYARGGSLDERKTPSEWIAWAASKGFEPYWLGRVPLQAETLLGTSQSDAALGAITRQKNAELAQINRDAHNARQTEWTRWKEAACKLQHGRQRKATKRELAELVKRELKLPDSIETIRKRI